MFSRDCWNSGGITNGDGLSKNGLFLQMLAQAGLPAAMTRMHEQQRRITAFLLQL